MSVKHQTINICLVCNKSFIACRLSKYCSKQCNNSIWYQDNKEHRLIKNKTYRQNEQKASRVKDLVNKWHQKNSEYCRIKRTENKDKFARKKREKYHTDLQFKLTNTLRSRLNKAVKGNQKVGSAVRNLGCSIKDFKLYIESKWLTGMTWKNWSLKGWHIDHIKPLISFDLTDLNQLKKACHYSNLQPMWAKDNLQKGDNFECKKSN